jgi:hypothetical protein
MADVSPLRYTPPPPAPRPFVWPPPSLPSDCIHPVPSQAIGPGGTPVPLVSTSVVPPITPNGTPGSATFQDGILIAYTQPT